VAHCPALFSEKFKESRILLNSDLRVSKDNNIGFLTVIMSQHSYNSGKFLLLQIYPNEK